MTMRMFWGLLSMGFMATSIVAIIRPEYKIDPWHPLIMAFLLFIMAKIDPEE